VRILDGGRCAPKRPRPRIGDELHVQERRICGKRCTAEECREALLAGWAAARRRQTIVGLREP